MPLPKPRTVAVAMGMTRAFAADDPADLEKQRLEIEQQQKERQELARKSREEQERLKKEQEAKKSEERHQAAVQLTMFFPQLVGKLDLAKGALELNNDNLEFAGNWLRNLKVSLNHT